MKNLITQPIITEKSLALANEQNIYTFEVVYSATKSQIKKLIEKIFEVEVEQINTIVAPSKRRRVGKKRQAILKTTQKKALVKLKSGQTIELFDISK